jgi:V-type H+-transporting ATPase subunit a
MVALMGFFAFYNGWIYNDFLSLSLNMFGSCYKLEQLSTNTTLPPEWIKKPDCTYPIGIDPVWSVSSNELTFVNSYKMKVQLVKYTAISSYRSHPHEQRHPAQRSQLSFLQELA